MTTANPTFASVWFTDGLPRMICKHLNGPDKEGRRTYIHHLVRLTSAMNRPMIPYVFQLQADPDNALFKTRWTC